MKLQADFPKDILTLFSSPVRSSGQDRPVHQGSGDGKGQTGMTDASRRGTAPLC